MESVFIFLILSVLFVGGTTFMNSSARLAIEKSSAIEAKKERIESDKREGVGYSATVCYVGGLRDVLTTQDCEIKMFDNFLEITLPSKVETIDFEDIIDFDGKSETEISKDVALTRLLLSGIFAPGLKKKTETMRKFFIITYGRLGKEHKLIFESQVAEYVISQYDKISGIAV